MAFKRPYGDKFQTEMIIKIEKDNYSYVLAGFSELLENGLLQKFKGGEANLSRYNL